MIRARRRASAARVRADGPCLGARVCTCAAHKDRNITRSIFVLPARVSLFMHFGALDVHRGRRALISIVVAGELWLEGRRFYILFQRTLTAPFY